MTTFTRRIALTAIAAASLASLPALAAEKVDLGVSIPGAGWLVTGSPVGGDPVAVAVLSMRPAVTSAGLRVWPQVKVHVSVTCKRSSPLVSPDCRAAGAVHFASLITTSCSVTLPVLVTVSV